MNFLARFVIALSLTLASVSASAQEYMFRYKMAVSSGAPEKPDYGSGNDIQAWFVAAVGYPFLKVIPVATKDVAQWIKDSGDTPAGLSVDTASGKISGTAEVEERTESTWYGLDSAGNRIARAQMHFQTFKPIGQVSEVNWYTHTGEYFYSQVPAPAGIEVVRWDPVSDNPPGMATRNGAFEGRPPEPGTYGVAWRGYDYLDREVAFTYGEFLVQNGPQIEFIKDQVADKGKGESFGVVPEVKHSIGTLTYQLKPVSARPAGLTFEATNGSITGVFQTFDTSASFVIEARDSGSGKTGVSNEFTLATLPETLDLSNMPDLEGTVGRRFDTRVAGGSQNLGFELTSGTLPAGIRLTTENSTSGALGILSGIPAKPEIQQGLSITASGNGAETVTSNLFRFRVFSGPMSVETRELHARVGTAFKTAEPVVVEGQDPPYEYRSATSGTNQARAAVAGVSFDAADGTYFSDGVREAGIYDQRLVVTNQSARARAADQIIRVYNELNVTYPSSSAGKRLADFRLEPKTGELSIRSPARFELVSGKLPAFLQLNPSNGAITGRPNSIKDIGSYGPFVVSLVDGFNEAPVLSNAFTIDITDRPLLDIRQVSSQVQRFVGNQVRIVEAANAYEGVTFSLASRGNLPSTLSLSPSGHLMGSTTDPVGTVYSGIKAHAVDGVGYTATLDISVTVVEPAGIGSIDGGYDRLFTWTKGRDFIGFNLPRVTNTYGTVTYALGAAPFALSFDPSTLALIGKSDDVGTFTVTYSVSDQTTRPPVTGRLTFIIQDDMDVAQDDVGVARGQTMLISPKRVNGIAPFNWEIVSGTLPGTGAFPSIKFDTRTGTISGTPRVEGAFPLVLRVTDATGQKVDVPFTLTVGKPLPFSFSYGEGWLSYGRLSELGPTVINRSEGIEWTFVSGTLPSGVAFNSSGILAGTFRGTPREDGVFDVRIKGSDLGTGEEWTETVTLKVRRDGMIGLPNSTIRHRAGAARGTFSMQASNLTLPARYELVDNAYPDDVSIDSSTGELSLSFRDAGRRSVSVKVTDLFGRTRTETVLLDILGAVEITVPQENSMKQFRTGSVPLEVRNLIGIGSYVISSGSLPSGLSVGDSVISGVPEETGRNEGIAITVSDSYDGNSATSEPFSIDVAARDRLSVGAQDYETNRYKTISYLPSLANAIGTATWTLTPPTLPLGLSFDPSSGSITGASDETFEGRFIIKAVDSKGGDYGTDEKPFTLKITERVAPEITNAENQLALLNNGYVLTLVADKTLGTVTWAHVGGTLPDGVAFDAAKGQFIGRPTKFQNFPGIIIELTDTFKGISTRTQKSFTIDVRQDGSPIVVTIAKEIGFRSGEPHKSAAPVSANTVGDVTWSATGLDGSGLSIDPVTGIIFGAPTSSGEISVTVTATDATGRKTSASTRIVIKAPLRIDFATETYLTYNYAFDGTTPNSAGGKLPVVGQPKPENVYGASRWSISPSSSLPAGLTFNEATGTFDGRPMQLGQFGPFTIKLADDLPGEAVLGNVFLDVAMNGDPIDLKVQPYTTKIGYDIRTAAPVYGNELGRVTFFPENNDLAGTNLKLDPDTGVLTGKFDTPQDRNVNVAISDEFTTRVTSRPLEMRVLPLLTLTGPQTSVLEAQKPITPIAVTPGNVAGTVIWQDLDQDQKEALPPGVSFDATTGRFVGQSDEIGVFGPFMVKARDLFHGNEDVGTSNGMVLDLRPGSLYMNLKQTGLASGTKRVAAYSYDFRPNLTVVGIGESSLRWSWSAAAGSKLPPGLTLGTTTGILAGTPRESGHFSFDITVSGGGKSSTKTFSLDVVLPETSLKLAEGAPAPGERNVAYSFDLKQKLQVVNVPVASVSFAISTPPVVDAGETAGLPLGISMNSAGVLTGTPQKAGTFKFTANASWMDNNPVAESLSDTMTYKLVIGGVTYRFKTVAISNYHMCGILEDGPTVCWGRNTSGQLGNGSTTSSDVPVKVVGLDSGVKAVSVGDESSCALMNDGGVKCWGSNGNGQLGGGASQASAMPTSSIPVAVPGIDDAKALAIGNLHGCVLTTASDVKCWGSNASGQIGIGDKMLGIQPVTAVPLGKPASVLGVSGYNTCAILTDGSVWCFGNWATSVYINGSGYEARASWVPKTVNLGGRLAASLTVGPGHACVMTTDAKGMCWGTHTMGSLLDGKYNGYWSYDPPKLVFDGITSMSAGSAYTCYRMSNGSSGCIGLSTDSRTSMPAANDVVDIITGPRNGCLIKADRTMQCWGANDMGQRGDKFL